MLMSIYSILKQQSLGLNAQRKIGPDEEHKAISEAILNTIGNYIQRLVSYVFSRDRQQDQDKQLNSYSLKPQKQTFLKNFVENFIL